MARKEKVEPLAEPQSPGVPERALRAGGVPLEEANADDLTANPTDVFLDESKPHYVGTENAPEGFQPQVAVAESGLSGTTPEVHVILDQVVPGEVYIPDEGRGDLSLPIHALVGARPVQAIFDEEASENADDEASDEKRDEDRASGARAT